VIQASEDLKLSVKSMEVDMRKRIQVFLSSNTIKPEEVKVMLATKANMTDIVNINMKKADKTDMSANEIKHKVKDKQNEHMLVILADIIQTQMKSIRTDDTEISSHLKYLMKQVITILNWVKGKKRSESNENKIFNDDKNGNMLQMRPINSALEVHNKTFDIEDTKLLTTNAKLINFSGISTTEKDDWLINTSMNLKNQNLKNLKKEIIFGRKHHSINPTARGSRVSRILRSKIPDNKLMLSSKVPHMNFPDPSFKPTSSCVTSTGHERQLLRDTLVSMANQDLRSPLLI